MALTEPLARRDARARAAGRALPLAAVDALVFAAAFAVALAAGAVVTYRFDLWYGDSLSRTADAYLVLYSRDPHPGAIGFVWPPLPTALRVALLPLTRPLGLAPFTGPLTSALFAAGCVLLLNRILRELELGARARALWVLAACANPIVLLHFANGTAESALACFMLLTAYCFLHVERSPTTAVLGMGTACSLALWVRYEAIALAGMAALALVLRAWANPDRLPLRDSALRLEAQLTALLAPVAFAGMLWMFANWSIQGDALFFYHSVHGARGAFEFARNVPDHPLAYAYGSLLGTAWHVAERIVQLSPAFLLGAVAITWAALLRRDARAAGLLLLAASTMLIQAYEAYTGGIHPWLRYWVYLPLLGLVLLVCARQALGAGRLCWLRHALVDSVAVPALLLAGAVVSAFALTSPEVEAYERVAGYALTGRGAQAEALRATIDDGAAQRELARYLRGTRGLVAVDMSRGAWLVLTIDDPGRLVANPDRDFDALLSDPHPRVRWLAVPSPAEQTERALERDAIFQRYPELYDGATWLRLEREFDGRSPWRLYEVVASPPRPPGEAPR